MIYGFLSGLPFQTPNKTLVLHGPRLTSRFWEVELVLNTGERLSDVVQLNLTPRVGSGYTKHSEPVVPGVTFECRVQAILDLARCLHDAAHVVGRLGAPVAADDTSTGGA
jgi:hypothetical protein